MRHNHLKCFEMINQFSQKEVNVQSNIKKIIYKKLSEPSAENQLINIKYCPENFILANLFLYGQIFLPPLRKHPPPPPPIPVTEKETLE